MNDTLFGGLLLSMPLGFTTAIMIRTWDAPPESVAVSYWTGPVVLVLFVLYALGRHAARRGRK